jgi:hypothetical protein
MRLTPQTIVAGLAMATAFIAPVLVFAAGKSPAPLTPVAAVKRLSSEQSFEDVTDRIATEFEDQTGKRARVVKRYVAASVMPGKSGFAVFSHGEDTFGLFLIVQGPDWAIFPEDFR